MQLKQFTHKHETVLASTIYRGSILIEGNTVIVTEFNGRTVHVLKDFKEDDSVSFGTHSMIYNRMEIGVTVRTEKVMGDNISDILSIFADVLETSSRETIGDWLVDQYKDQS